MWNDCPLSSHIHDPSRLIKVWLMRAVNLISQLQLWQMPTLYGCRELEQMWFMTSHRALNLQCSKGNCRNNKMILTWYCTFIDNNQGAIMITMMEWELHDTTKTWTQHETCQCIMKISALNIFICQLINYESISQTNWTETCEGAIKSIISNIQSRGSKEGRKIEKNF